MRKSIIRPILLAAALSASCAPAFADKSGVPNAAADSRAGKQQDRPNTPHKPEKPDKTGPGTPKPDKVRPEPAKKVVLPATDVDAVTVLTEVESRQALSLAALTDAVADYSSGRVLDIMLLRVGGRLIYDVIVVEGGNVIRHLYLDAETGQLVRTSP